MNEVWKIIPGLDCYEVSSNGHFRRIGTERPVAVTVSPHNGYGYVRLGRGQNWKNYRAHRLVLLAHVGPPGEGLVARHLDGNKSNNTLSNLVWGSQAENIADKARHGTLRGAKKGERHHQAKLTDDDIQIAKGLYAAGWSQRAIAYLFGASQSGISRILSGASRQSAAASKRAEMRL
jgi:hypothetical protein